MGGLSFKPVRVPCSSVVELPQCKSRVAKFHSCFFSLFCRRETPNTQYTTAAWIERIVILGISNAPKGILLTADGRWLDQLFRQYCIQWLLFSTTLHRLLDVLPLSQFNHVRCLHASWYGGQTARCDQTTARETRQDS